MLLEKKGLHKVLPQNFLCLTRKTIQDASTCFMSVLTVVCEHEQESQPLES